MKERGFSGELERHDRQRVKGLFLGAQFTTLASETGSPVPVYRFSLRDYDVAGRTRENHLIIATKKLATNLNAHRFQLDEGLEVIGRAYTITTPPSSEEHRKRLPVTLAQAVIDAEHIFYADRIENRRPLRKPTPAETSETTTVEMDLPLEDFERLERLLTPMRAKSEEKNIQGEDVVMKAVHVMGAALQEFDR